MAPSAVSVVAQERERARPGPPIPADWKARYLEHVRTHGHYALAARRAGVSPKTAERERAADPDFDAECRDAREEAADGIEIDMLDSARRSDNPAGFIVRLKALRPHEYIEKHAVMNFTVSTELASADGLEALQAMFETMRPSTQALIQRREASSRDARAMDSAGESGSATRALPQTLEGQATTESPA